MPGRRSFRRVRRSAPSAITFVRTNGPAAVLIIVWPPPRAPTYAYVHRQQLHEPVVCGSLPPDASTTADHVAGVIELVVPLNPNMVTYTVMASGSTKTKA